MGKFLFKKFVIKISRGPCFYSLVAFAIMIRIIFVYLAGSQLNPPWTSGSDAPHYVLLAENLLSGKGYTYAGQPTAFRPPGYPFLLAFFMFLFKKEWLVSVRLFQLVLSVATALICRNLAQHLWGELQGKMAFLIALWMPTLIYTTSTITTETITAFLIITALFVLLVKKIESFKQGVLFGVITGLVSLFRFNAVVLFLLGLAYSLQQKVYKVTFAMVSIFIAILGPWTIRNLIVFKGRVFFSTEGGFTAVYGTLDPQARGQANNKIRAVLGWFHADDLETNSSQRLRLPSEDRLDREAWKVAVKLWRQKGISMIPLILQKLSFFWLSIEQLFWTKGLSLKVRIARFGGVIIWWGILALAIIGLHFLSFENAEISKWMRIYMFILTLLHLPFGMSTRFRVPLFDPLMASLAGGGIVYLTNIIQHKDGKRT